MPPPLPRDVDERALLWGYPDSDVDVFEGALGKATHLSEETQAHIRKFRGYGNLLRARFGLSRDTDHEWFPVRPLGCGSFGGVGVWERRDAAGNILEETAVKTEKWTFSHAVTNNLYMAREAPLMRQLNKKDSEHIVYLKAHKAFSGTHYKKDPEDIIWRFYFEHCPYGDLSRLQKRYKIWG
jgi:hypothetical protein